jgi:hypothetical protein
VDSEGIRNFKQTLLEEGGCSVGNHTITFHFSESQTTISGTTFDGLSSHDLNGTTSSGVDLVVHHVTESLVVRWSEEYLCP